MIAKQVAQDVDRLESPKTFVAFLEKVEIEETNRRGLLTLRPPSGDVENIHTEQEETNRGRQMIEQARSLVGRWVLVYRYNEEKAGNRQHNVRMLAHLVDLGNGPRQCGARGAYGPKEATQHAPGPTFSGLPPNHS